jgi:hypothetical protein
MLELLVNNESEGAWKEAVVTRFEVLSGDLPEGAEETQEDRVGFQVLSAVTMKCAVLWVVTPRCSERARRRFGRTFRQLLVSFFSYSSTLKLKAVYFFRNVGPYPNYTALQPRRP